MTEYTQTRPLGKLDADGRLIYDSVDDLAFQGDYSGSNLIYKGFSRPGSATTDSVWQIAKLAYDGSSNLTSITWPQNTLGNASSEFVFVWNDRASYTYV